MDTRVATISIIVGDADKAAEINNLLHEYAGYIIGRMGLPYQKKGVNIICIAIDAPQDAISALSGKIGRIQGVSVKTTYGP